MHDQGVDCIGTVYNENQGGCSTGTEVFAVDGTAHPVLPRYVPAEVDLEGSVQ